MDDLLVRGGEAEYHWTLTGTNTWAAGTDHMVRISGSGKWRLWRDGLIASSQENFDAAEPLARGHAYFRIELSLTKLAGLAALLVPTVPARRDFLYVLKEWAYAGFAITLVSALVAHLAVRDGVEQLSWSVGTGGLWGLSYFFWRRLQTRLSEATDCS